MKRPRNKALAFSLTSVLVICRADRATMGDMSMQQYPRNPIEKRKQAVRKYARRGVVSVAGGLVGGTALYLLSHGGWAWLVMGLVFAVVSGWSNWNKIQKIVNHKDEY